jgi:hypothetical protein
MISGSVYPLRLGWYGIVGRSHEATLAGNVCCYMDSFGN